MCEKHVGGGKPSLTCFSIYAETDGVLHMKKRKIIISCSIILISILAEFFVFNYKHWVSLRGESLSAETLVMGASYEDNKDGTYTMVGGGDASIYLGDIQGKLVSSYIHIVQINRDEGEEDMIRVWQTVTDESNRYGYELPVIEVWAGEERSNYHLYHLYGNCTGLTILPNLSRGDVVMVEVVLNPVIPIFFSWGRVGVLMAVLGFLSVFRPGSVVYSIEFAGLKKKKRFFMLVVLFAIHGCLLWKLSDVNPAFTWGIPQHHKQYQKLVEALAEGSFALLEKPSHALQKLDNPYDYAYRDAVLEAEGEEYAWDTAYFEGKYYVYFGVVPVLLFYLPYYLITGSHLPNYIVIFLASLLLLGGGICCLQEAARKWFPQLSLGMWLLTTELVLIGSGILYLNKRPDLYNIPIVMGIALGLWGLWCFLKAEGDDSIRIKWLVSGTLLTAFIAGCRPQLILFAVFPLILFRKYLFSGEFYRSGKGKKAVIAVVLSLAVVGGGLMFYNYSRFGSVTDFGANYNLTTNDMRRRGWVWGRLPLGLFVYFLQPMKFTTQFPFVEMLHTASQYPGTTIQEYTAGGVFFTHLFAWFGVLPVICRRYLYKRNTTPWLLSVYGMILAVLIAAADVEMAGILWRYQNDFLIFVMIAAALGCWMICCHPKIREGSLHRLVVYGVLLCVMGEVIFQAGTFFLDTGSSLKEMRPDLYAYAKYLIGFWL